MKLRFGFIHKAGPGAKIERACRAIEEMLFKLLANFGRQLIQEISLRRHLLNRFTVIHRCSPH